MILADHFANELRAARVQSVGDAEGVLRQLSDCARFTFPENVSAMASDAITRPVEVAALIPLPAPTCWIEFRAAKRQIGVLARVTGQRLRAGFAIIVTRGALDRGLGVRPSRLDMDAGGLLSATPTINRTFLGAVAMLATPDLVEKRPASLGQLNRARASRGKAALLEHEEIVLDLGKPMPMPGVGGGAVDPQPGSGTRHRQHFTRAHLRFRLGAIELVRPHWRGDAALGTLAPNYRVRV